MTFRRVSAARTRTVRLGVVAALAVAGLMTLGTGALADPGDPNTSFSGDGYVPAALKYPNDVYVRDSGKVVTAGSTDGQLIVEKRLSNGRLDTAFGTGGRFVMEDLSDLPGWSMYDFFVLSPHVLVADQGGSIIVAFSIVHTESDEGTPITWAEPYLLRLTRSGRLDRSFGNDGFVEVPGRGIDQATIVDMAVDARGRITLLQQAWTIRYAGRVDGCEDDISCDNTDRALVTRLRPDGTPLLTFDGALTAEIATTWPVLIEPIALAVSGKSIVVLHRTFVGFDTGDFAVARFTTTGRRDMSYGGDGTADIAVSSGTIAPFDITARPDGGSFVAADVSNGLRRISLVALTASGSLDTNFSADGVGQYEVGRRAYGAEVVVAPNGVAYVAGESSRRRASSPRRGFVLAVRPGGSTVTTFGSGGTAWFEGATTGRADVRAIALGEVGAPLFAVGTGWGDVPAEDVGFVVSLQTR